MQLDGESADLLGATLEGDTIAVDIDDLIKQTCDHSQSLSYLVSVSAVRASRRCAVSDAVAWVLAAAPLITATALVLTMAAFCLFCRRRVSHNSVLMRILCLPQVRETKLRLTQAIKPTALCEPMAA